MAKSTTVKKDKYPTKGQVNAASRVELARWYRFLRGPENDREERVMDLIMSRFKDLGGMTVEISKKIGLERKGEL